MSEPEATMPPLDEDRWIRFDTWAARSWDSAMRAVEIAIGNGPSMMSDDGPDGRVLALFHSAEVAKEFAFAVNPNAPGSMRSGDKVEVQVLTPDMIADLFDADDD